ncbi:hypothetical protein PCAR4_830085 [Paraburkholderia caribensis]|nr:hypothetical protein PCAR4_830085 [Paraburkholderia caribensis]
MALSLITIVKLQVQRSASRAAHMLPDKNSNEISDRLRLNASSQDRTDARGLASMLLS